MKNSLAFLKKTKGMTYVELLVAFSILAITVVLFTPMFMLAYNNLYDAGEMSVKTYNAKSYIEKELATRQGDDLLSGGFAGSFLSSTGTTLSGLNVAAKRVYSDTVTGLETLYYGNKVYVRVISDTEVPDDTALHLVSVVTTNLNLDTSHVKSLCSVSGSSNISKAVLNTDYKIDPSTGFTLTAADAIMDISSPMATLTPSVAITVTPADNLINIKVDNTDITTTIIKFTLYYKDENKTTKMISRFINITPATIMTVGQTKSNATYFTTGGLNEEGNIFLSGRVMTEGASTTAVGTNLNVVKWIFNDATIGEGYYAIGGANGTIRRLWHLNSTTAATIGAAKAATAAAAYTATANPGYYEWYENNTFFYKYTWNGDYTNIYYRYHKDKDIIPGSSYQLTTMGYFMSQFNGYSSEYAYASSRMRRISYAIEEANYAANGLIATGYWAKKYTWNAYNCNKAGSSGDPYIYKASDDWWYRIKNIFGTKEKTFQGRYTWNTSYNVLTYTVTPYTRDWVGTADIWDSSTEYDSGNDGDGYLSMLCLKNYNNYVGADGIGYLIGANYNTEISGPRTSNPPNITDVAYVEGLSSAYTSGGSLLYIGVTPANALINQTTGVNTDDDTKGVFKAFSYISDADCSGCTLRTAAQAVTAGSDSGYGHTAYGTAAETVTTLSNLNMTMGYASNRTLVYGTLDTFKTKAYESAYFDTLGYTPSDYKHNVWFTSEFYNLTKEATVEAVTVAVGYAVGGKASQGYTNYKDTIGKKDGTGNNGIYDPSKISWSETNAGYWYIDEETIVKAAFNVVAYTKLDAVNNDAVIAAFQNGDATTTTSMKNVYYLKETDSVRFTAVDIGITDNNNEYCLAVGDSKGRVHLAVLDVDNTRRINLTQIKSRIRVVLDTATSPFSQINSVSVSKSGIIVTGISETSGKTYVAYLPKDTDFSTCTSASWTILEVKTGTGAGTSVQYDCNDIELIGDTYFIAASWSSGTKGALLYCKTTDMSTAAGWQNHAVLTYTTAYDVDSSTGAVIGSGTAYDLPPLYSVAGH